MPAVGAHMTRSLVLPNIRVTPEERQTLERAASLAGVGLSEYIRRHALEHARRQVWVTTDSQR